jgi:hypothetical protein
MEQLTLFSATLGLSMAWQVTEVNFEKGSNRLDIRVQYAQRGPLFCPACGAQGLSTPVEWLSETWYHSDFFNYATYLHARVPLISCGCGGLTLERPWCRAGSRFAKVG